MAALGAASAAQATVINTTSSAAIAAFQSGATVQTFDNIAGVTAAPVTAYTPPVDLTGSPAALFNKDPAQPAFFNSGGASFNNPTGNPGTPIAVVAPSGLISGDKLSGNNVAGPLAVSTPPFTLFDSGAFMEVIFPTPVSKVGLFVAHGSVQLILKDTSNQNLTTGDFSTTGSSGQFIGIERASADIGGVTMLIGAFTIDDFTYGTAGSTGGGGGGGANGTVPDSNNAANLAIAGAFLMLANWKFNGRKVLAS